MGSPDEPSTALYLQPTPPKLPREHLRGWERLIVPAFDAINSIEWMKRASQLITRHISKNWMTFVTRNRWELHGMEPLARLEPKRGVLLVANHRTFWDMFVASAILYHHVGWMEKIVFPVRANFFYTNPIGALVNLSMAGCGMWPPVFRDDRKPLLNPTAVTQMSWILAREGTVLGMHPEGTRNKGDDPYTFLPARPGVGYLIRDAHPDTMIVPYFLGGMTGDLLGEIRRNFKPEGQRGPNFRLWFGEPIRVGDLDRDKPARDLSQDMLDVVHGLAMHDKEQEQGRALPNPVGAATA